MTKVDTELTKVSVPTKKIQLELIEGEHLEIVLRPFKQKHFATAIAIINKYFDEYNQVRQDYLNRRKAVLEQDLTQESVNQILAQLDATYNEGMEIAKAVMAKGDGVAEDISTIIEISIYKATTVVQTENATERSPIEPELEDLTWGECAVLLGSVVGLNMDFFSQNSQEMNLEAILNDEPQPKETPKASDPGDVPSPKERASHGAESSADSSALVTATAK